KTLAFEGSTARVGSTSVPWKLTDVLGAFASPIQAAGIGLAPETWTNGAELNGAADAPCTAGNVRTARQRIARTARQLRPIRVTLLEVPTIWPHATPALAVRSTLSLRPGARAILHLRCASLSHSALPLAA